MLTAYVFCLLVGGGFLALSVFGDFLDGMDIDVDVDIDGELDAGGGADVAKLLSLRTVVYALFGFGATGSLLHWLWAGASQGLTLAFAGVTGLASGALISTVFRYLRRTGSGTALGEQSFVGLTGEVSMEIAPGDAGTVKVVRGERRYSVRARMEATGAEEEALPPGRPVVVVDMADGVATVVPVEMDLIEE